MEQNYIEQITSKNKKDYNNSKIYCIRNSINDMIYIGSTTQPLSKRMGEHRNNINCVKCKNYKLYETMRELGRYNFYIELIENYECTNLEELRKREGQLIREYKTELNHRIAGRTGNEWYYKNKAKKKTYYETNKDKIKEYQKEWSSKNEDKIKTYRETNKEDRKDKARQRSKEWYEINRDRKKAYQKMYHNTLKLK